MNAPQVLLHTDAGAREGWGHLRESLEVAVALRSRGVQCLFVVPKGVQGAVEETTGLGFQATEVPPADWQSELHPTHLRRAGEVNNVRFAISNLVKVSPAYAAMMRESMVGWACITELADEANVAPTTFNVSTSPEYIPLGPSYRNAAVHPISDEINRVLICYGGSDPQDVTSQTLEWLKPAVRRGIFGSEAAIDVVIGPLYTHHERLKAIASTYPITVSVAGPLEPSELARIAVASDIGITTAGGTMYEFSALGLPSIIVPVLPKHVDNARVLEERGVVVLTDLAASICSNDLISMLDLVSPPSKRRKMSEAGQRELDGQGADRIADRLCSEWGMG